MAAVKGETKRKSKKEGRETAVIEETKRKNEGNGLRQQ